MVDELTSMVGWFEGGLVVLTSVVVGLKAGWW